MFLDQAHKQVYFNKQFMKPFWHQTDIGIKIQHHNLVSLKILKSHFIVDLLIWDKGLKIKHSAELQRTFLFRERITRILILQQPVHI